MKNNNFHNAIDQIKSIRMTEGEKASMKARILGSAVAGAETDAFAVPVKSPWNIYNLRMMMQRHSAMSVAFAIVIAVSLSGTGAVFASEKALPGDILYPLKVAILEPIRGGLAVSSTAKAEWEASLMSTRLREAETLEQEGKLDEPKKQEIDRLLDVHAVALDMALAVVEKDDSVQVALNIDERVKRSVSVHDQRFAVIASARSNWKADENAVTGAVTDPAATTAIVPAVPVMMSARIQSEDSSGSANTNEVQSFSKVALKVSAEATSSIEVKSNNKGRWSFEGRNNAWKPSIKATTTIENKKEVVVPHINDNRRKRESREVKNEVVIAATSTSVVPEVKVVPKVDSHVETAAEVKVTSGDGHDKDQGQTSAVEDAVEVIKETPKVLPIELPKI